jgi:hypothetical protein
MKWRLLLILAGHQGVSTMILMEEIKGHQRIDDDSDEESKNRLI